MLGGIVELEDGFKSISEETKQKYGKEIEQIRELIFIYKYYEVSMEEYRKEEPLDILNSLVEKCYLEGMRLSGQILFLIINGLYKNAYDSIRYIIESGIQSLYLDDRHPKSSLSTKIEIWREIENAREYHAQSLIGKLNLGELSEQRTRLDVEYKKLSQEIHFGHKQVLCTIEDVHETIGIPSKVNKEEIIRINDSLRSTYDIFFLLMIVRFPKTKELLIKNKRFLEHINKHNLSMLKKILNADNKKEGK